MYKSRRYSPVGTQSGTVDSFGLGAMVHRLRSRGLGATPTLQIMDLATGSSSVFTAGDPFTLQITGGAPNAPVSVSAANTNANQGTTDANGNFSLTDITPTAPGQVTQTWTVGGVALPLQFTILAPPTAAASTAAAASGTVAGQAAAASVLASATAASASPLAFLTSDVSIFGYSLPVWGVGAAGLGLLLLFSGGSKRR